MRTILLFFILILTSCFSLETDPEVQKLYDEVMEIHDAIMPETSTIHKLKKKIKKRPNQDSTSLALIQQLDEADESMMVWMADFAQYKELKGAEKQEKIQYLNEERVRITQVSQQMTTAMKNATEYLNQSEPHE